MAYPPEVERWRPLVEKYFKPEDVDKALWVIYHESGGNPQALGDGGASGGLFQLNDYGLGAGMSNEQKFDPETNIATAARAVYGGSGWRPWGEGALYNGKPFGALGNNPYPGSGGAAAMSYGAGSIFIDPTIDALWEDVKTRYNEARQKWIDAGRPSAFVYDEDTGELVPNADDPVGFEYANAYNEYVEFLNTHQHLLAPGRNHDPAQQAFQNQLALGDLKLREAQLAWQTYLNKLQEARNQTDQEMGDAARLNEMEKGRMESLMRNNFIGAKPSGRTWFAPTDREKVLEKWKQKLNVGEEPDTPDIGHIEIPAYTPPSPSTPPAASPNSGKPLDTALNVFLRNMPTTHGPGSPWYNPWDARNAPKNTTEPPPPAPPGIYAGVQSGLGIYYGVTGKTGNQKKDDNKPWWKKLIPGFANGVQNFQGGPAMLGERGPEEVQVPGLGNFMVGIDGPEVRNLPPGSNVVPLDQKFLFARIQQAAREGRQRDKLRQQQLAGERARDPQLRQKVMQAIYEAMAAHWAANPPRAPILVGDWSQIGDPWADIRPLADAVMAEQQGQQPQQAKPQPQQQNAGGMML